MASRETILVMTEAILELTLGRNMLCIWVFIAKILDVFILRMDVM
jgi:hypothetical protein